MEEVIMETTEKAAETVVKEGNKTVKLVAVGVLACGVIVLGTVKLVKTIKNRKAVKIEVTEEE